MFKDKPDLFMFRRAALPVALCLLLPLALLFLQMGSRPDKGKADVTVITLTAVAGLQFDQVRFAVKPGARVKVVLKNRDDMSHNLVFTKPGARLNVVNAAMKLEEKGPEMNYIPVSDDVLWSIPVLSPGEERFVTFQVPEKSGIYPYVCTFPGHGFSMYGAMYVTAEGTLPPIESDTNIPPARQKNKDTPAGHAGHTPSVTAAHPYALKPPYFYRAYMEDSSPASIAVHLPYQLSYCWDADACELRYAWEGDFVDNSGLWKGKPNSVAKVLGNIFYRNQTSQPIRIGNPASASSKTEYKGFQLRDRYPEFHYTVDDVDVYELIRPAHDGSGLHRTFRMPNVQEAVWFCGHPDDGVSYDVAGSKMTNAMVRISPQNAREFTIVMTKKQTTK